MPCTRTPSPSTSKRSASRPTLPSTSTTSSPAPRGTGTAPASTSASTRSSSRATSCTSPQHEARYATADGAGAPSAATGANESQWFQRAFVYEVLVRGFFDANNDGTGDIRGITERLDHIQWLGADCLWLLPFYQSPLRDGGYDISDFFAILPEYGDLADVVQLIEECHKRDLRVIADLVMNHTSDQHAWFQESRQDRTNPKADWYVWSDDDTRYPDARIIFVDTERSNWSWDPVREQFYWHRFFSHQPDLNYDNPEVQQAMLDVVRFWLDLGLDGFRLDAVPYLYERDGTNGENLPETHAYLKRLRKEVDAT